MDSGEGHEFGMGHVELGTLVGHSEGMAPSLCLGSNHPGVLSALKGTHPPGSGPLCCLLLCEPSPAPSADFRLRVLSQGGLFHTPLFSCSFPSRYGS